MLLNLQFFITTVLSGFIWAVQLVIYPMFLYVPPSESAVYFKVYQRKVSFLVLPLMLGELGIACLFFFLSDELLFSVLNMLSILLIWGVTFFESVHRHQELLLSYKVKTIKRLINGNWVRTALWTARALALGLFCFVYKA